MLRLATKEEINYAKECRSNVKGASFCMIYGGGVKTLSESLMAADPSLSEKESKTLATKLIKQKKGYKNEDGYFYGGSDSAIYNAMIKIANSSTSELPALGTKISAAMRRNAVSNEFITARTNFCIQASGSEMLSVILTFICGLIKEYNINANYVISINYGSSINLLYAGIS